MKSKIIILLIAFSCTSVWASHKVYFIHGFGGLGIELEGLRKNIENKGYVTEIFKYPSLSEDIEITSKHLYYKIKQEKFDSVSFVTHSLGALVVRSMYNQLNQKSEFPFIFRFVMIASPNQGSPLADFWSQFDFVKYIAGPNVENLTTDPETGAAKFPIPNCEIGLIAGITGKKTGYNIFINGDDDGIVPSKNTKMGNEKDVVYVKLPHIGMVLHKKVINFATEFLENGYFTQRK